METFIDCLVDSTGPDDVQIYPEEIVLCWDRPIKLSALASYAGLDREMFCKSNDGKQWCLSVPVEIANSTKHNL